MLKHHAMMRHRVIGKAKQNAVQGLGCDVLGSITSCELDVGPGLALAEGACPREHAGGDIDPVDAASRSNDTLQGREVSPAAAADLQNAGTGLNVEPSRCKIAQMRGATEQPVE